MLCLHSVDIYIVKCIEKVQRSLTLMEKTIDNKQGRFFGRSYLHKSNSLPVLEFHLFMNHLGRDVAEKFILIKLARSVDRSVK